MARRCGACRTAAFYVVKFFCVMAIGHSWAWWCMDNWMWEPRTTCQGPAKPENRSGIQVLIRGMAKTGTKSIVHALNELGYATYHSEDFYISVWTGIADEFWRRPEKGGCPVETPLCPGIFLGGKSADVIVKNNTSPQRLAAEISRCKVDALAFDGMDMLYWPISDVSPDAKVISMSWRTYPEYRKSRDYFKSKLLIVYGLYGMLTSSHVLLPYNIILIPLFDYFSGGEITDFLRTGHPTSTAARESIARKHFRAATGYRRWYHHAMGGLEEWYNTEEEFNAYFEEARQRYPSDRLLEWDMRRHTMKDLCKFLGITGNPKCDKPGTLPRMNEYLFVERESITETLALMPLYFVLVLCSWQFLNVFWGWLGCCPCLFEPRRKKKKEEKKEE